MLLSLSDKAPESFASPPRCTLQDVGRRCRVHKTLDQIRKLEEAGGETCGSAPGLSFLDVCLQAEPLDDPVLAQLWSDMSWDQMSAINL